MYHEFFGFRERPFQLVPNPEYLFLGRCHEEALAHLKYAISNGEGFVELTGEVGTGKTTLCRYFLDSLGEDTEAAYIFNPNLNSVELLKAINDEFEIDSSPSTVKELIGILNQFLLEKKAERKNVILLIDEAQNLKRTVLEQIRLISNLETSTQKLIQIILVGQPELAAMLGSHELRQLSQRITLSCHLYPLTRTETRDYIFHRIRMASQSPKITLSDAAINKIYRYARGIPRLINMACDRTFLVAFVQNKRAITKSEVAFAIQELEQKHIRGKFRKKGAHPLPVYFLLLLCLFLIIYIAFYRDIAVLFHS